MVFNSIEFIVFLILVVPIYFLINKKYKLLVLLVSSYYFYMAWKPEYIILIIISTIFNYFIAKLIDIANYYNKDWKADFNNESTYKYVIQYNGIENKHTHYSVDYDVCLNRCCVYFKNQEDAQAVIDNPNFRDILDSIYKD